jgi:hypothetical protein
VLKPARSNASLRLLRCIPELTVLTHVFWPGDTLPLVSQRSSPDYCTQGSASPEHFSQRKTLPVSRFTLSRRAQHDKLEKLRNRLDREFLVIPFLKHVTIP